MPSSILRPNISIFFFRRKVTITLMQRTQKVVVLMPPAVEPVAPPLNMSQIMTNSPASVISVKSTVLNPAVLADTD